MHEWNPAGKSLAPLNFSKSIFKISSSLATKLTCPLAARFSYLLSVAMLRKKLGLLDKVLYSSGQEKNSGKHESEAANLVIKFQKRTTGF